MKSALTFKICILLITVLDFSFHVRQSHADEIIDKCISEWNTRKWSKNEYGWCVHNARKEQAEKIHAKACNDGVCLYKLEHVGDKQYIGQGYHVHHHVEFENSWFTSILSTDQGDHKTTLKQSCGSSCPLDPKAEEGPFKGASYKGPFESGATSFIILRLPIELSEKLRLSKRPVNASNPEPEKRHEFHRETSGVATIPKLLQGKTLTFQLTLKDSPVNRANFGAAPIPKPFIYDRYFKFRFSLFENVYEFHAKEEKGKFSEGGYLYKYGKDTEIGKSHGHMRYGTISMKDNKLTILNGVRNEYDENIELNISSSGSECEILTYSNKSYRKNLYERTLLRNGSCRIY